MEGRKCVLWHSGEGAAASEANILNKVLTTQAKNFGAVEPDH